MVAAQAEARREGCRAGVGGELPCGTAAAARQAVLSRQTGAQPAPEGQLGPLPARGCSGRESWAGCGAGSGPGLRAKRRPLGCWWRQPCVDLEALWQF